MKLFILLIFSLSVNIFADNSYLQNQTEYTGYNAKEMQLFSISFRIMSSYKKGKGFPIVCTKDTKRLAIAIKTAKDGNEHFIIGNGDLFNFNSSRGFKIKDFENTLVINIPKTLRDIHPDDFYQVDQDGNMTALAYAYTKYGPEQRFYCVYTLTPETMEMSNKLSGENSIFYGKTE